MSILFSQSDAPGAPGKPQVTDYYTNKITITWTPPESDGGSPITGYFVERKEKTSSRWVRVTKETITETTLTVTGLTEGTEYQFRVYAENLAGPGPASEPSDLQKAKLPFGKNLQIHFEEKSSSGLKNTLLQNLGACPAEVEVLCTVV